jgi:uncharacterized damage-inducible protein DinB
MTPYTLADTWLLNNRVNLMLLEQLTGEQLAVAPSSRARNVGDQIAHLHNARIMWLEAQEPAVARTLAKIEKGAATKAGLKQALEASGAAFAALIDQGEKTGKLKSFKRGVAAFLGYVLAHEAHHRGQILVHLKHAGMPVDRAFSYAIWEWEKI